MLSNNLNSIIIGKRKVSISVSVYLFKEGDVHIAYCPSLDLVGYDITEESARSDFEFILTDWLETQVSNGTLQADLSQHGWKLSHSGGVEPSLADMLSTNEEIIRVSNMPEYLKINACAAVAC